MFARWSVPNPHLGLQGLRRTICGRGGVSNAPFQFRATLFSAAHPRSAFSLSSLCPPSPRPVLHLQHSKRRMSDIGRGTDLLADSLAFGKKRKVVLDSYMPTGFDVLGMLDHAEDFEDVNDEKLKKSPMLHMNGSIIAFPHSCFLWKVGGPKDVTLESLSVVALHDPAVEFLFIGCDKPLPPRELNKIKRELKERDIVVEQMDLTNAMGTFNILNGEDRRVAVALVIDDSAS